MRKAELVAYDAGKGAQCRIEGMSKHQWVGPEDAARMFGGKGVEEAIDEDLVRQAFGRCWHYLSC